MSLSEYEKTWDRPPLNANGEKMKYWFPKNLSGTSLPLMYRNDEPVDVADNAHREIWRDRECWLDRALNAEVALKAQSELVRKAQRILTKCLIPDDPDIKTDKEAISALLTLLDGEESRAVENLTDLIESTS